MGIILCARSGTHSTSATECRNERCKRLLSDSGTETRVIGKIVPRPRIRIKESMQVSVRISTDKVLPTIMGCKFMKGGQLLLCDTANKRVKVLSRSFDIKLTIDLTLPPYDVGIVDDETIVVSMPEAKRIKFIQIYPALVVGYSLFVGLECYGIDVAKDEIFVACHAAPRDICFDAQINVSEVRIYNMQGVIQRRVSVNMGINCIAVDTSGENIYTVTSCELLCVSKSNEIVFHYKKSNLKEPSALCLDESNNIVVCCADSLQIIYAEGKRNTTLSNMCDVSGSSTGNTFRPGSVALRSPDRTLVVAGKCSCKLLVMRII